MDCSKRCSSISHTSRWTRLPVACHGTFNMFISTLARLHSVHLKPLKNDFFTVYECWATSDDSSQVRLLMRLRSVCWFTTRGRFVSTVEPTCWWWWLTQLRCPHRLSWLPGRRADPRPPSSKLGCATSTPSAERERERERERKMLSCICSQRQFFNCRRVRTRSATWP